MTREELEALEKRIGEAIGVGGRLTVRQAMGLITMNPELLQSRGCVNLVLEAVDRDAYARGHEVGFQDGKGDSDNAAEEGAQHHEP